MSATTPTTRISVSVIGIGAGCPEHISLQAIAALQGVDAVVALDKGETKADLLALRQTILDAHAPSIPLVSVVDPERDRNPADYKAEVKRWHAERARLLAEAMQPFKHVAFLVWGDPSLYDSTLRILERMQRDVGLALDIAVIPGITAVQALTAAHALTLNRIGEAIHITTGRNLPTTSEKDRRNCVVMLDGGAAWLEAYSEHTYIWWGAFLGTPQQVLREGYVHEIGQQLKELKAQLRAEHGWIMDTYLLRELDAGGADITE